MDQQGSSTECQPKVVICLPKTLSAPLSANDSRSLLASVGLRNVLTHEYVDIDLGIVAAAVTSAGQYYGQYVQQMARWIAGRQA